MINKLINYALEKKIIEERDIWYVSNRISNILGLEPTNFILEQNNLHIQDILTSLTDDECKQSLIMDVMIPMPSLFEKKFHDANESLEWFYSTMKDLNYIKTKAIDKNIKFKSSGKYGDLEVTINFSKPEKDPKEIAELKKLVIKTNYPKCQLCVENEGYYGRIDWNDRSNHRMIKLEVNNDIWYLQYSPYQYYNHHAILLNEKHSDMQMTSETFNDLFAFIDLYPNYFIGSNAELPIVGGSILNHAHYQCGKYLFPINRAKILERYYVEEVECSIINWPLSTIKLSSNNKEKLINIASKILDEWRLYDNEELNIYAFTDCLHNTITPILFKKDGIYELFIVLRNNLTSDKYPFGIFHAHEDKHHIKKENIGLIEVMGLAILPPRIGEYYDALKEGCNLNDKLLYNKEDLETEIGIIFEAVLEDCGVFTDSIESFKSFVKNIITTKS